MRKALDCCLNPRAVSALSQRHEDGLVSLRDGAEVHVGALFPAKSRLAGCLATSRLDSNKFPMQAKNLCQASVDDAYPSI